MPRFQSFADVVLTKNSASEPNLRSTAFELLHSTPEPTFAGGPPRYRSCPETDLHDCPITGSGSCFGRRYKRADSNRVSATRTGSRLSSRSSAHAPARPAANLFPPRPPSDLQLAAPRPPGGSAILQQEPPRCGAFKAVPLRHRTVGVDTSGWCHMRRHRKQHHYRTRQSFTVEPTRGCCALNSAYADRFAVWAE